MNYVDGVPVKIGEKFKPPKRIALPLNFQQRDPTELLNDDYDFNLERHVLELSASYRKKKEEKARAREDTVANQIEQFSRQPVAASDGSHSTSSDESPSGSSVLPSSSGDSSNEPMPAAASQSDVAEQPPINNAMHIANMEGNDILKPVRSDTVTALASQSRCENRTTSNIKLEDFEAESSPFDSMELKTLNDMEELKSVLQGMSSTGVSTTQNYLTYADANTGNVTTPQAKSALNGDLYCYPNEVNKANNIVIPEFSLSVTTGGYPLMYTSSDLKSADVKNSLYATALNNQLPFSSTDHSNANFASTPCSVSWTMPPVTSFNPYATKGNLKMEVGAVDSQVSDFSTLTSKYFSSESPCSNYQSTATTPGSDSSVGSGGLRNARSTPDLIKELGKLRKEEKRSSSSVRPPRPNSIGSVEETVDINSSYEQKKKQFSRLSNPYTEMIESETSLVQKLVDMGFPQDRTARAVKKFGIDDKKVIDHLCAVQSLIEKGFNPEKTELALFLYEDDEEVANYFLQLLKQFLDLGFEEEAIKKALYLTKNDRDKALDYLVS